MIKDKNEMRRDFLNKRLELTKENIKKLSNQISLKVYSNFFLLSGNVGIYFPIRNEVDILILTDYGVQNTSIPLMQGKDMIFKKWNKSEPNNVGRYGVIEPLKTAETVVPSTIIVPLVAFDEQRNRLGYGSGYYDRYLQNYKGLKIGVAFEVQKAKTIPAEKLDIKLDYIVTESSIY